MFLLKILKQQGIPLEKLNIIYNAIIVSRITYALPVWAGFLTADLTNRINALLAKSFRYGYTKQCNNLSKLISQMDDSFFKSLKYHGHCAHYLLPPPKAVGHNLRQRGHNYQLPRCKYNQHKNSFICRYLYRNSKIKQAA